MALHLLFLTGCGYEENLPEVDLSGTVVLPRAAATREIAGEPVVDARFIGAVYLGAFSGIENTSFPYPHPVMGPILSPDTPGDTFPFGGTTVGRFDFACYESLVCKVVTGRFEDYNSLLDFFADYHGSPVLDANGEAVDSSSTFQQACYDYFYATSDQEMSFIGDMDFTENADGDFEASWSMPHTLLGEGVSIWGWMDAPVLGTGAYSTCDPNNGRLQIEYSQQFYEGQTYTDVLNFPSLYISEGDWVADGETRVTSVDDNPVIQMNISLAAEDGE